MAYQLIAPDPACPLCSRIMAWRAAHPEPRVQHRRLIVIGKDRRFRHASHLDDDRREGTWPWSTR